MRNLYRKFSYGISAHATQKDCTRFAGGVTYKEITAVSTGPTATTDRVTFRHRPVAFDACCASSGPICHTSCGFCAYCSSPVCPTAVISRIRLGLQLFIIANFILCKEPTLYQAIRIFQLYFNFSLHCECRGQFYIGDMKPRYKICGTNELQYINSIFIIIL